MTCVGVFGASGFVGATLVERLYDDPSCEVVPFIHSSGNAARLARHGRPLRIVDLMAPATLRPTLDGVTHVVNCSRGPAEVMTRGFEHLLSACRQAGVRRVVHLSSVAVYGEGLPAGEIDEQHEARPAPRTYGALKLQQDTLAARFTDAGLPVAVLCPPNISGPYSAFLQEIVQSLRRHDFALVDDGRLPCELVDVENLVHAIRCALQADAAPDGRRIFVTDVAPLSWRVLADGLCGLADYEGDIPTVAADVARSLAPEPGARVASLGGALMHLVSSDVRSALKKDPWLSAAEARVRVSLRRLAPSLEPWLKGRLSPPVRVRKIAADPAYNGRLLSQQLRGVTYATRRARALLGYEPVVTFAQGLRAFVRWNDVAIGRSSESWLLARELLR